MQRLNNKPAHKLQNPPPKKSIPQEYFRPGYRPPSSYFQDEPGPFEAKRMRKAIQRRTIDFNALIIREIQVY
jgi:hypothetical protein